MIPLIISIAPRRTEVEILSIILSKLENLIFRRNLPIKRVTLRPSLSPDIDSIRLLPIRKRPSASPKIKGKE